MAASMTELVVLVAALVVVAEAGKVERDSRINEEGCMKNYKVDFLFLSLFWGPGFCTTNQCSKQPKAQFTIHGLWPQQTNQNAPAFCCARDKFSRNQLKHLTGSLKADWPTLDGQNNDHASFWEHEYMKHGRCTSKIPGLDTVYGYFSFSLKLFQKWDPKQVLEWKGITPSNTRTYSGQKMQSILSAAFGNKIALDCGPSMKNPNEMVLRHIRVCIDTDLNRIGCPYTKKACLGELKYPASS